MSGYFGWIEAGWRQVAYLLGARGFKLTWLQVNRPQTVPTLQGMALLLRVNCPRQDRLVSLGIFFFFCQI